MTRRKKKEMNKKTAIVSVLLGVLLIGIVSATLLTYFGKITGTMTVSGPVFYLDGQISTGVYHKLLINKIPNEPSEVNWSDGHRIVFETAPLNINHFYKAKFNFIFYAKANSTKRQIQMSIIKINPDNFQGGQICYSGLVNITSTSNFRDYALSCTSSGPIALNLNQGIAIEIWGTSPNITDTYSIRTGHNYTHGYSRIEVTAA